MTKKKYKQITDSPLYVYITYETRYSRGKMEFKGLFYIEMYKRLLKLLKGVKINMICIKNEETGIVYKYCDDLLFCYSWLLEHATLERGTR